VSSAADLRYCRLRAGLTQRELGSRVGVPQPAIARIESGRVIPRVDTLRKLLTACGFGFELQPLPDVDRTAIRELMRASPRHRLDLAAAEANNLARIGIT
jgi:transcriptional regulator with XRE-family HTH domain